MAEGVGFEPTWRLAPPSRFRVDPVTATSVPLRAEGSYYSGNGKALTGTYPTSPPEALRVRRLEDRRARSLHGRIRLRLLPHPPDHPRAPPPVGHGRLGPLHRPPAGRRRSALLPRRRAADPAPHPGQDRDERGRGKLRGEPDPAGGPAGPGRVRLRTRPDDG